jgi:hypothetical protein
MIINVNKTHSKLHYIISKETLTKLLPEYAKLKQLLWLVWMIHGLSTGRIHVSKDYFFSFMAYTSLCGAASISFHFLKHTRACATCYFIEYYMGF